MKPTSSKGNLAAIGRNSPTKFSQGNEHKFEKQDSDATTGDEAEFDPMLPKNQGNGSEKKEVGVSKVKNSEKHELLTKRYNPFIVHIFDTIICNDAEKHFWQFWAHFALFATTLVCLGWSVYKLVVVDMAQDGIVSMTHLVEIVSYFIFSLQFIKLHRLRKDIQEELQHKKTDDIKEEYYRCILFMAEAYLVNFFFIVFGSVFLTTSRLDNDLKSNNPKSALYVQFIITALICVNTFLILLPSTIEEWHERTYAPLGIATGTTSSIHRWLHTICLVAAVLNCGFFAYDCGVSLCSLLSAIQFIMSIYLCRISFKIDSTMTNNVWTGCAFPIAVTEVLVLILILRSYNFA